MGRIFGGGDNIDTSMYLPLGSCSWKIDNLVSDTKYQNIALLSLTLQDSEAVDIRRCFNDITHIFAFGRDFKSSYIIVTLICFIGKKCKTNTKGLDELAKVRKDYDKEYRIYKSEKSLDIQIDGFTTKGFLVGMSVGNFDPVHETCKIMFAFIPDEDV